MRLSSAFLQQQGIEHLQRNLAAMAKTQNQLASGLRLQTAADQPADWSAASALEAALSKLQSYQSNGQVAAHRLNLEESALASIDDQISRLRELALQANNATMDPAARQIVSIEMQGRMEDLLALANSRDADGRYLFGGTQDGGAPFTLTATGATYHGDGNNRQIPISDHRSVADGDAGDAVFQQPHDVFATVQNLIASIQTTPLDSTAYDTALAQLQTSQNHLSDIRATVGNRLNAIDDASAAHAAVGVQTESTLSSLREVDYAAASARLAQQDTALQAAQASYVRVQSLSLFNFLR